MSEDTAKSTLEAAERLMRKMEQSFSWKTEDDDIGQISVPDWNKLYTLIIHALGSREVWLTRNQIEI